MANPTWQIAGASDILSDLEAVFTAAEFTVSESGTPVEQGFEPTTDGVYGALWTRDNAYTIWHYPALLTPTERRQFVTHRLSSRTDGSEADPDGGTLPADWIADRIDADGDRFYKNAGFGQYPFMDGIAFVILALWTDWQETGDLTTFTASQAVIDDCLAVLPRSASGCVWSDPADPSVDYGFTDSVLKTGDVAYGTALLGWAAGMLAAMADENGSGTYTTLRDECIAGLATLRQGSGWYAASSGNNATRDDVWATALIVAEGLVSGSDRAASALALADAYVGGTITQNGWTKHLPTGQAWAGTPNPTGSYQNGGYWLTPLWDCVRAVDVVDSSLARTWAAEALAEVADQLADEGTVGALTAPYEWRNGATLSTPKGYVASAAVVRRFV